MPPVVLVTDSSACVPLGWRQHPLLRVLPLGILADDRRVSDDDGSEATALVAAARAAGHPVATVAPSPVDFLRVLDPVPGGAVVVTPAAEVAVMHRNAVLAARLAGSEVLVVDSATAGPSHGLCVVAGLQAADDGADTVEVAAAVTAAAGRARLVAATPDLSRVGAAVRPEWPAGGGPDPGVLAAVRGRAAVFRFHDGVPVPVEAADVADPLGALVATWQADGGRLASPMVVFHADDAAGADELRRRLATVRTVAEEVPIVPVSAAMAVHTGSGCLGVAWLLPEI